jgi:predicted nuclease of predicted toxin-antitoxin system
MKFLANENMPSSVIHHLRSGGHDVLAAKESLRGECDEVILARAQAEGRVLISQDKDFGELAFRSGLPADCGVVLFRLDGPNPEADSRRMIEVLSATTDWLGRFSVVDERRVRSRPIPPRGL